MTETPEDKTRHHPTASLQDPVPTGQRPLKILVVEDNPINQKFAAVILAHRGHQVSIANNGKEAVSLYPEGSFDLILMDVEMPEMDGIQATKMIREHERGTGRHIPIIALTAHAMRGDRERFLAEGMDGYISKPVNSKILYETIEAFTNQAQCYMPS